ncbi:MAG: EamA family transporter, partial [archaeon]
ITILEFLIISIICLIMTFVSKEVISISKINNLTIINLLITSVFSTALAFIIQNRFQKYLSEIQTVIIFSLEPLFTVLIAYIYLNEILTVKMLIGGLLIIIGTILVEVKNK